MLVLLVAFSPARVGAAEPVKKVDEAAARAAARKAIQEGDYEKAEKNLDALLQAAREQESGGTPSARNRVRR